jgi:hypothetical protein
MPLRSSCLLLSLSKALFAGLLMSTALGVLACSGGSDETQATAGGAGTSNIIVGGGGHGNGSGGGGSVSMSGNTCVIDDNGTGCAGQAYEGEGIPLDIYIMFDQSGTMGICLNGDLTGKCPGETRLDAVRDAADQFMADAQSNGIGVGLGYFGKQPLGQASCDPADHEAASVEVGLLPDHAGVMMESLNGIQPTGETPTGAGIRGACSYAQAWKNQNPSHEVVILLLTDGIPEAPLSCNCDPDVMPDCVPSDPPCCPTAEDAVAAAAACLEGDPGIKTYVLGVGPELVNLNGIAEAGGTGDAYLVAGGDVANDVLGALRAIRGDAIPCSMKLPPPPDGQDLNLGQVNMTYASSTCEATYFNNVEAPEFCGDAGGWYYDDPNAPESIELCPTSCDQVSEPGGKLLFTVGCATRYVPR